MRARLLLIGLIAAFPCIGSADPVAGILTEWRTASCDLVGVCQGERCTMPPAADELAIERDADTEGNDWRILHFGEVDFESNPLGRDYFMRPFYSGDEATTAIPLFAPDMQILLVIYPVETETADQIFEVLSGAADPHQNSFRMVCSGSLG